jgi:hypothetical protein
MTLVVAWIGKDSRKTSSIYLASDSRISWSTGKKFDAGRKVFAFQNSADILAYCGDVLYPTLILSQILEMDKDSILFPKNSLSTQRIEILYNLIVEKFKEYPSNELMAPSLEILHISRQGETDFICFKYIWTKKEGWSKSQIQVPDTSDKIIVIGSGEKEFKNLYSKYLSGNNGKTSRALFQCFCHTLLVTKDSYCGGSPQLVGLYNRYNGKNIGVIYKAKKYYIGRELAETNNKNQIEWRNEMFERCDETTLKILDGAQRQPNELYP